MSEELTFLRETSEFSAGELEEVFCIPNYPVLMGCTNDPYVTDIFCDMKWGVDELGIVQLMRLIDLDFLYFNEHQAGTTGGLWLEHHNEFAAFISKYSPASVFEIGGAHGILSKSYNRFFPNTAWTIIEPDPSPEEGVTANIIEGFFGRDGFLPEKQECIVHSHVFEHIYQPYEFLRNIWDSLEDDGIMLCSIPNIGEMLARGYTNAINFEHTIFYDYDLIVQIFKNEGFDLIESTLFKPDHSIFYAFRKSSTRAREQLKVSASYKDTFKKYTSKLSSDHMFLKKQIASISGDIFLFGAHVFSQTLLALGLDEKRFTGILDNEVKKQGKRLYGTSLEVFSPEAIHNLESVAVILRAGAYNDEITEQLRQINPGVRII
jgi:hypothetical protein